MLSSFDILLAQLPRPSGDFLTALGDWVATYPQWFAGLVVVPLLLASLVLRAHPRPVVVRWMLLICLLSVGASLDGSLKVPVVIAAEVSVLWLVSDWFPRAVTSGLRRLYRGGAAVLIGLLVAVSANVWMVVVWDVVFLGLMSLDVWTLPRRKHLLIERKTLRVVSLQQRHQVQLHVSNRSWRTLRFELRDDIPQEFQTTPEEFDIRLRGKKRMTFEYWIRAMRRGEYRLEMLHIRFRSLLGLWSRYLKYPMPDVLHVYPDMKQLSEYAILARNNRLSLMGVKRTRKIGQDNEFERLRDYTVDDNFRHLDWKATARRNKLTVRDFQVNQSQRLIFLIDCGRMMANEVDGISLLDHAINAMLMASYVALRQGDSVGLVCFSDRIHTYVPPRGGMKQMNQLLHAVFNRHPQMVESRYDEAFLYLRTHCRKRSLVIMVSNVIDEVNAIQIEQYLATLVGKHLPLGVLLRDHALFDAAERRATRPVEAYTGAAAAEILAWRHQLLVDLSHRGVLALDVFPEDMTAPLVNSYLQIKARHLL